MSDEGSGSRPGEEPGGPPKLRYSRERRLEKAPESVRWLASRYGTKPPGIMRSLVATRANRLLLFTIIALIASFNLVPLLFGSASAGKLGGDRYSAKAFWFEDRLLVSLERQSGRPAGEEGAEGEEAFIIVLSALAEYGKGAAASAATAPAATAPVGAKMSFAAGTASREEFRLAIECPGGKPAELGLLVERGAESLKLELEVE
ncbi:MAG TPA: hypothetical protein PLB91_15420 [Spirochaetales bacterium]|nr:hypothetical protein [Spirochaetales bacterium]